MNTFDLNPFQCSRPISDPEAFYGRRTDLRELAACRRGMVERSLRPKIAGFYWQSMP
jgi:hypothetical protein